MVEGSSVKALPRVAANSERFGLTRSGSWGVRRVSKTGTTPTESYRDQIRCVRDLDRDRNDSAHACLIAVIDATEK